jgi:hypothetical protein
MVSGWLIVGVETGVVALGMAEDCSAYRPPAACTTGSAKLAKRNGSGGGRAEGIVVFMLPETGPFNSIGWTTLNYAQIAVGVVVAYSATFWFVSARKWITDPRAQGDEAELSAIEQEFTHIEAELEGID